MAIQEMLLGSGEVSDVISFDTPLQVEGLTISPELVEAVDAAFTDQVETLESISISPEQENKMGVSNKPNISTDHHLGSRTY